MTPAARPHSATRAAGGHRRAGSASSAPGGPGTSLALALTNAGWDVAPMLGRADDLSRAAEGVDLLVLATPDDEIRDVARAVGPGRRHGGRPPGRARAASRCWPRTRAGPRSTRSCPCPRPSSAPAAWWADGSRWRATRWPTRWCRRCGGRAFTVDDADRATYHAAAVIASNHLVALLGQAERLAESVGVPFDAYLDLATDTLANVAELGPVAVAHRPRRPGRRGHAPPPPAGAAPDERRAYRGMIDAARRLAEARDASDAEAAVRRAATPRRQPDRR